MVSSDTSKIDISHSHDITAFVEGADPSHLSTQFQITNPTISNLGISFYFSLSKFSYCIFSIYWDIYCKLYTLNRRYRNIRIVFIQDDVTNYTAIEGVV